MTRLLPDLASVDSATETFTYTVPVPVPDGQVMTGTATASGTSAAGTPEEQTNNNTASVSATARSARCKAIGAGAIGTTKSFVFAAEPRQKRVVGLASYLDLTPGARRALVSVEAKGIACFKEHARIFGNAVVNPTTRVAFRLDVDDLGSGPGTDRFSISWPGYAASGTLTRGDVTVIR